MTQARQLDNYLGEYMEIKNILASDIGGTNSRFAHFRLSGTELELVGIKWLNTADAGSFDELVDMLHCDGFTLEPSEAAMAVFAVAGPVVGGTYSNPPAIPWAMDISGGCPGSPGGCLLINDFVAQAYACLSPLALEAEVLMPGSAQPGATLAVMGAGTGMGKAALVPDGHGGYAAMPSEGGHIAFAFEGEEENEYRRYLLEQTGEQYMTPNTVVSGGGMSLLHRFLTGEDLDPRQVVDRLTPGTETLRWAARFYARVARDFALETLALGGLYIAGGVASRTPAIVEHEAFREEFLRSPKLSALLGRIPVYLQSNQDSGLWGAAIKGRMELQRGMER